MIGHAYSIFGALAGVAVFHLLNLPLPWLLGPLFACLFMALAGLPLKSIKPLNTAMRTVLGVAVGATFTSAMLVSMSSMWTTLILIPVMIVCIGAVGIPYFQRLWGYDFATSYYSAMPGGLQDMLIFGHEAGADVRALSLIHATRVMVVVVAMPILLQMIWDADLSAPPGAPAASMAPSQLLLMAFCGLAGWQIAKAVGLFGASILGPMILTGAFAIAGIIQYRPPAEAIWAAQFFIGMAVGNNYAGVTMSEIKRDVTAGLGFCLILIVLTVIFAEAIYLLGLAPSLETLLAFAPAGQAEMTVLAIIVGADTAFVIAHHVLRIVLLILGAPIAARLFPDRVR